MRKSIHTAALSLVAAAALTPAFAAADGNPFGASKLTAGYQLGELANFDKHEEGKCGEGKCGGKPEGEGKCGAKPEGEGKCGEGKCGAKE